MQPVLTTSKYGHQITLGMKVDEVVFLLGEPDDIIKGEVFDHWSWVDLRDDEGVVDVTIEILHGVVSSISIQGMSTS